MIIISLCRNTFQRVATSSINNYCKFVYFYRNYHCESYEKKLEESKILSELNSSDKEKLNLYYSLKKIQLQNENLFETIKNLENKIDKIIIDSKNKNM
jgi:hypothetical protein